MSKKRRRVDIKVLPLPSALLGECENCPLCGQATGTIGRLAKQFVFRCEACKVTFKRVHATRLDF